MLNYHLKFAEQETSVTFDREQKVAHIYTSDRTQFTKLDKLCKTNPDSYKCVWVDNQVMADGLPLGKKYETPAKLIRFGKPASAAKVEACRRTGKINGFKPKDA